MSFNMMQRDASSADLLQVSSSPLTGFFSVFLDLRDTWCHNCVDCEPYGGHNVCNFDQS